MADDLVLTPGGYRPRSMVHQISSDTVVSIVEGRLVQLDSDGGMLASLGDVPTRDGGDPAFPAGVNTNTNAFAQLAPAPFGSGWIAYAGWTVGGTPISSFSTTWTVPPAPRTSNGQTVFFFNGIQNALILQPVLQWGPSAAGGGAYWSIGCWYAAAPPGVSVYSTLVNVNPGDVLTGVMTMTGSSAAGFNYTCVFTGYPSTSITITNQPQLTWANETLEAYAITACSDYPAQRMVSMSNIILQTGAVAPGLTWSPTNSVTDCNQSCTVVSNSASGGEVDLYLPDPNSWESRGGQIQSGVGGSAWSANRLDLCVQGMDNAIWHMWWDGSSWGGWESLGGQIADTPSVVSWSSNRLDVFARGTDSAVWHTWWDGSSWGAPESLGGQIQGNVTAVAWGSNRLDLFVRGMDNAVYHKWFDGSNWAGSWESLGGQTGDQPTAVAWGSNRLDIFCRGTDNAVWHKWWDGSSWHDWESLGGQIQGTVTATSWAANRLDLFVHGMDDAVWHQWFDGSSWGSGWESLGGQITNQPTAVCWGPNRIDAFARGTDGAVWHKWWDGSNWGGWESQGGQIPVSDILPLAWGSNRLDVFVRGTDNAVWHRYWDGSSWGP